MRRVCSQHALVSTRYYYYIIPDFTPKLPHPSLVTSVTTRSEKWQITCTRCLEPPGKLMKYQQINVSENIISKHIQNIYLLIQFVLFSNYSRGASYQTLTRLRWARKHCSQNKRRGTHSPHRPGMVPLRLFWEMWCFSARRGLLSMITLVLGVSASTPLLGNMLMDSYHCH